MTARPTRLEGDERPRLRRYASRDFRAVRRLWRAGGLHLGTSDTRTEIERSLRRDPDLFIVAERDGRLLGAVLGRFDGRRGWVNHLAVDPTVRSRGVGSMLMRELERRLQTKGCRKVNLHVTRANRQVSAFYEALGYAPVDLLFMEKRLPA